MFFSTLGAIQHSPQVEIKTEYKGVEICQTWAGNPFRKRNNSKIRKFISGILYYLSNSYKSKSTLKYKAYRKKAHPGEFKLAQDS